MLIDGGRAVGPGRGKSGRIKVVDVHDVVVGNVTPLGRDRLESGETGDFRNTTTAILASDVLTRVGRVARITILDDRKIEGAGLSHIGHADQNRVAQSALDVADDAGLLATDIVITTQRDGVLIRTEASLEECQLRVHVGRPTGRDLHHPIERGCPTDVGINLMPGVALKALRSLPAEGIRLSHLCHVERDRRIARGLNRITAEIAGDLSVDRACGAKYEQAPGHDRFLRACILHFFAP